ncbi:MULTISPECIES: SRPBCC domain-containing protein [unclassified Luteococcus]|uniref:SRPBCC domain-containing protein n=1 Tax=unclassified Luteococcus TaxID=2639923 RepID=UPI00313ED64A
METLHGRLEGVAPERAMLLTRELAITVDELWRWLTEPERTQQWYGPWRTADGSTPAVGDEILVTMTEEEGGDQESAMRIEACEPPYRLALVSAAPAPFDWPLTLTVEARPAGSAVTLRHDRIPADVPLADLGAGWEFYLVRLVAAIEGSKPVSFEHCLQVYGPQYAALG